MGDGVLVTRSNDQTLRLFDLATGALQRTLEGSAEPEDVTRRPLWELLGDGPVSFHRRLDPTPLAWFQDSLEEVLILQGGLIVDRGRTVKDFLYVLKLHHS